MPRKLTNKQQARVKKKQDLIIKNIDSTIDNHSINNKNYLPKQKGLVIANYKSQLKIQPINSDQPPYLCHLRKNIPPLVVGDKVIWCAKKENKQGIVLALLERKNVISRPNNYKKIKPIASNIDFILITSNAYDLTSLNIVDRYLVAAELENIEPILVFNKIDLLSTTQKNELYDKIKTYNNLKYKTILTSTITNEGFNVLKKTISKKTSVLVGMSGVGKSSIINKILPDINKKTRELSFQSGLGKHTTSVTELFNIPSGGSIIDSPGIRSFGLWNKSVKQICSGFREFKPLIEKCLFKNCHHRNEKGCAIIKAYKDGYIAFFRLKNFYEIIKNIK